jgi:monoterpene epsilon-lactone hydrolase
MTAQDSSSARSDKEPPGVHLPARFIPVPRSVSPEAQAYLAHPMQFAAGPALDPVRDKAAWKARNDETNRNVEAMLKVSAQSHPADVVTHKLSNTAVYEVTPKALSARNEKRVILYLHGGSFVMGGGMAAAYAAMAVADVAQMRAFALDYRMPPEHPYPAAIDDEIDAYRWLLAHGYQSKNIAVYGGSAGGNLAAAFVLKARDIGLPMPGACVLHTPAADMTRSGDTFEILNGIDPLLSGSGSGSASIYAPGHDLKDPYISPVFGDFTKGFSPTILSSGTRDMLLSSAVMMHRALRRAGIKAELDVYEAMPHGGFLGTNAPENREVLNQHVRFMDENLGTD